jgi:hypothetical protein
MTHIRDQFGSVLGSIGIVALAIAILLVPKSDLNAANPGSVGCAVVTCAGTLSAEDPPGCTYAGDCNLIRCQCTGPDWPVQNQDGIWICPPYCQPVT